MLSCLDGTDELATAAKQRAVDYPMGIPNGASRTEKHPMKAAVYYKNGGPEVLKYEDVPDPVCPSYGVVVRAEAISIEGGDVISRMAEPPPTSPYVPGYQAAGEVVEVGTEVEHLTVGQMVTTVGPSGSHAGLRAVPARGAWPVPDGLDIRKAAAIPVAFGTADECLFRAGKLTAGETVLVAPGVGRRSPLPCSSSIYRYDDPVLATQSTPAEYRAWWSLAVCRPRGNNGRTGLPTARRSARGMRGGTSVLRYGRPKRTGKVETSPPTVAAR